MSKQKRLSKWGNSVGVRIPKSILDMAGFSTDDDVYISCVPLDNGEQGILISKAQGSKAAEKDKELYDTLKRIEELVAKQNKNTPLF
jgi:antitoxin component of MazEF toxin-antitoxin module